ncbi:hypothetical protein E1A91_D09G029200v1 [Gossypium mustelinum]|uniref:WAT1-related protein n=1 Tax=Gossypium mustelinum TaxID=34275 RepID=A0A5D2TH50_GOSMU|nr:hypothetical protein E1A91_D09G029200v1 [Gossypium mustelinum]
MARRNEWKELVIPCIAMVAVECSNVTGGILFKAASFKGMSYFVFTAYSYLLSTLVFLFIAALFKRKTLFPPLKFPLFSRIFLLGLLGFSGQLCLFKGIQLSSPTLASALGNLTPALTFMLAVFFRIEKVAIRSSSCQAKIIGTFTSIFGALVITFYKGPKLFSLSSSVSLQRPLVFMSYESNWIIGGLLEAVAYLILSLAYIIQSQVMKIYPEEITVSLFSGLLGTIISLPICILAEPNLSSWKLSSNVAVVAVLYTGLFGLCFGLGVHVWGIRLMGPVFVASFKPTSIVIAVVMSAIFLGEAVFLGSVFGTLILSTGLYSILWGKAREEEEELIDDSNTINGRVPLLQSQQS